MLNITTEDQIERRIERGMDSLDLRLMAGTLSQVDYDRAVADLHQWGEDQYAATSRKRDGLD